MFTKFGGKVEHGPGKNPLDFGGNPDHVSLGLELGYTVDVLRHTRLDLGARALHGFCLTVIKRDWRGYALYCSIVCPSGLHCCFWQVSYFKRVLNAKELRMWRLVTFAVRRRLQVVLLTYLPTHLFIYLLTCFCVQIRRDLRRTIGHQFNMTNSPTKTSISHDNKPDSINRLHVGI